MPKKTTLLPQLGENIRKVRKKLSLSQEALALESGLDRSYIGGIERGERNVAVINLCRIARVLKVKPGKLLDGVYLKNER